MDQGRPLEYGVFIEGVFGVCGGCGSELTVDRDMQQVHMSEDDASQVHMIWYHASCGPVMEYSLDLPDFKAAKSWLRRDRPLERTYSDSELIIQKFRQDMEDVFSLKEIGWLSNGHE